MDGVSSGIARPQGRARIETDLDAIAPRPASARIARPQGRARIETSQAANNGLKRVTHRPASRPGAD